MTIFLGIVLALLVFNIIVFAHEMGHFLMARFFGVRVEEFGLGIPPKIKKIFTDTKKTIYTINWLPFGGFVRLKWEDPNAPDANDADSMSSKPIWQQIIVVLGGVLFNFLFAWILLFGLFLSGIQPFGVNTQFVQHDTLLFPLEETAYEKNILIKNPGVVLQPMEASVAEQSGIQNGDIITHVNNIEITSVPQFIEMISKDNQIKTLNIKRNDTTITQDITPVDNKIGAYVGENISYNQDFIYKFNIPTALRSATEELYNQSIFVTKALGSLLRKLIIPKNETDRQTALENVGGPIAIGGFFVDFVSLGVNISFIILIMILININLGVFNLLPFPALDGGRFIILSINGISLFLIGKILITPKVEGYIHAGGFLLLIGLSILIAYKDILVLSNW